MGEHGRQCSSPHQAAGRQWADLVSGAIPAGQRPEIDGEPVVLRCDLDAAVAQPPHRVVPAMVTEGEFEGPSPDRQTKHLMAEADPEQRHTAKQAFDRRDCAV